MVEQPTTGYPEMATPRRRPLRRRPRADAADRSSARTASSSAARSYLGPFATPGSFLVNVAKHKTHSMGLTLCVKNLQGTNVPPYIRFCGGLNPAIGADFQPDAQAHVDELYERHRKAGLPRWDTAKGAWMEMWAQRTIDHYALVQPSVGLHVIEGIYAQNGDGFDGGPGASGLPEVFMTNVLVFGRDAFRVDIVGHWLGGHEPGNFGLFHLARERGVSTALDPKNVPVYAWTDDGPRLAPLDRFARVPLATPYLPEAGRGAVPPVRRAVRVRARAEGGVPVGRRRGRACARWAAGPPRPSLRRRVRAAGRRARPALEVYDDRGRRAGVVAADRFRRGIHAAEWRPDRAAPGTYWWRLRAPAASTCCSRSSGEPERRASVVAYTSTQPAIQSTRLRRPSRTGTTRRSRASPGP